MQVSVKFNPENDKLFPKQFKKFKGHLKDFMRRLKNNDIDNFSYKESVEITEQTIPSCEEGIEDEIVKNETVIGTFTLNDPELDVPVDMGTPVFFSN